LHALGYADGMKMLARWLLLAATLLMLTHWNIGVSVSSFGSAMLAAFVIGLLNAFVRPLLIVLTLPVTLLTLGLFLFVINAFTFQMASGLLDGFQVQGFWQALLGSVLYSLCSIVIDAALERLMGPRLPPPV
jgi:putative membrane protein